jgi:hypothetical protein
MSEEELSKLSFDIQTKVRGNPELQLRILRIRKVWKKIKEKRRQRNE